MIHYEHAATAIIYIHSIQNNDDNNNNKGYTMMIYHWSLKVGKLLKRWSQKKETEETIRHLYSIYILYDIIIYNYISIK